MMASQPTLFDLLGRGKKRKLNDSTAAPVDTSSTTPEPEVVSEQPTVASSSAGSQKIRIRSYRYSTYFVIFVFKLDPVK
jgi:hypothetical protein